MLNPQTEGKLEVIPKQVGLIHEQWIVMSGCLAHTSNSGYIHIQYN